MPGPVLPKLRINFGEPDGNCDSPKAILIAERAK